MRLAAWMAAQKMTLVAFGQKVGVSHSTVSRWCRDEMAPSMEKMVLILDLTDGEVTPNDFMPRIGGDKPPEPVEAAA